MFYIMCILYIYIYTLLVSVSIVYLTPLESFASFSFAASIGSFHRPKKPWSKALSAEHLGENLVLRAALSPSHVSVIPNAVDTR